MATENALGPSIESMVARESGNHDQDSPASGDKAHLLVKALEEFILPIINARAPALAANQNTNDVDHSRLGPEAQQLLAALEKYISSIVGTQINGRLQDENGNKSEEEVVLDFEEGQSAETVATVYEGSQYQTTSQKPSLLKHALEQAYYHVFNKMPIRLLSFNTDGSDMQLIERAIFWDRISTAIYVDLNDYDKIKSDIRQIRLYQGVNDSGAERILIDKLISKHTRYAILSHTWLRGTQREVTYADWESGTFDKGSPGYQKLVNFCKVAAVNHNATLGWMDTVCINKDSSSELDESIRSMYKWYHDASVCLTYLAQTTTLTRLRNDPWFTRGWTLQELLAPRCLKFYGADWEKIVNNDGIEDDKRNYEVQRKIQEATTINGTELRNFQDVSCHHVPISRRMQWAATRRVTREEDMAYSLMGIFDVSISIAYGEGSERAFLRLVKEILTSSKHGVLDIVNWGFGPFNHQQSPSNASHLIPSSPKQYLWRADSAIEWPKSATMPVTLTHLGLHLPILLMPAISPNPKFPDAQCVPVGNYFANAVRLDISVDAADNYSSPNSSSKYVHRVHVLDRDTLLDWKHPLRKQGATRLQLCLGVLNFSENETSISLPSSLPCFAIALSFPRAGNPSTSIAASISSGNVERIPTTTGIIFHIEQRTDTASSREIPKGVLAEHGMHLVTMYL